MPSYKDYIYAIPFEREVIHRAMAQAAMDAGEPLFAIEHPLTLDEVAANERFIRLLGIVGATLDSLNQRGTMVWAEFSAGWCAFFIAHEHSEAGPWKGECTPRLDRSALRDLPDHVAVQVLMDCYKDIPARVAGERYAYHGQNV